LLREKVTALIKSLPKQLRVNFVPAPDFAERAYEFFVNAGKARGWESLGSINDALAKFLSKQQGVTVPPSAFDPASLLDHLHANFKIVDEAGKQIAMGRDLNELRRRLGIKVKTTFEQIEHPKFNRDDVTEWDFGDLPESVQVQRHGMTLTAYPALAVSEPVQDQKSQISNLKSGISLRLFDSRESAAAAHAAGLRRLFIAELHDEIRYFAANVPGIHQMCLHYATLGPCQDLKDDIVGETINRAFLEPDTHVRTQMEFELRKQAGRRHRLLEVGREVATLASQILDAYHQVALQLNKPTIPAFGPTIHDVRQQLAHLMPKCFLTTTPDAWLLHYPRFLKAILLRLQKLTTAGHSRDATYLAELTPFWTAYVERLKHKRAHNIHDAALEHFRWMLEEFRVSLFAQELKTSIPISAKRLEKQWELVRK
jgi:ATP-dependent helicase HrpA